MRKISRTDLFRMYLWLITTRTRIFMAASILALVLAIASTLFTTLFFFIALAAVFVGLGMLAYGLSHSAAPLQYPIIDRFFQKVPCYLSIQNRDLRIVRINELFRRDFGDKIGEHCYKAYKGSDEICPDCPVVKTFVDGKTHHSEEEVITTDGEKAQMIVYATPVPDQRGNIIGVMEMSTNITDLKKMQAMIEAGRKEYYDLFQRVPCFISVQDKDFRIIRSNEVFKQEFGDREGEFCFKVYKNRSEPCPNCPLQKTFEDKQIHSSEETVIRSDGSEMQMIVYSSPIFDENGNIGAVMEMATDITEVKKLQQELTLMGRTIAVMAHRIKNILMGLEGGIFVVNTGMEENNETDIKQGWEMIERNVDKISHIVRDLLYCSKDREMKFESIDPATVIRNVYELFSGRAEKEDIGLNLQLPESLPEGRFDPDALHSLLTNLVANSFDACVFDTTEGKDRHEITIRGAWEEPGRYVFEVEDNGTGIPGINGESVFEEFFSTKGREGTGLGLLVAHKVVEEHGGTITFDSKQGQGTTFRAIFPAHKS